MQLAAEKGKQTGFARAIAAHQTDVFAGVDGAVNFVEHHFGASSQGDVFKGDHSEFRKKRTRSGRVAVKSRRGPALTQTVQAGASDAKNGGAEPSIVP